MLQQTLVATVIPYFEQWMVRFPTIATLAQADEQEVLAMWQGLGYYRRAKLLHKGAQALYERKIDLPRSGKELLAIPGIGPYTAGAIASIAFNEPAALVDGNVERVFSRLTGCRSSSQELKDAAWRWAGSVVHADRPGEWNQALMELGAVVCKPLEPACLTCPLQSNCVAFRQGLQSELPIMAKAPKTVPLVHHVWIPTCDGRFGVRQILEGDWWAGMWEFPRETIVARLEEMFPEAWPEAAGSFKHSVTHHRIQVHVSRVRLESPLDGLRWLSGDELCEIPMPAPQRKALRLVVVPRGDKGTTHREA